MAARPRLVLDYGGFREPPSRLFTDYLLNAEQLRPFFDGGGWDLEAMVAAAERTRLIPRRRDDLAAALVRQQRALGADQAAGDADRLRREDAVAVVTGQQPGLFGGPLLVLYKALATLEVAACLEKRRGAPVVPVFWVAADDHDFTEVRQVTFLDAGGQLRTLRYAPALEPTGQPAARIVLDESVSGLVEELRRALPEGVHVDSLLAELAECYRPGASLSGAFGRLVSRLLPGLVVLDPSDPELKRLMAPVMSREVAEGSPTSRLALQATQGLLAAGYHQQVPLRPGFLNLFVLVDGERRALSLSDGSLEVRGLGRRIPLGEAERMLSEDPGAWSPGALLRPLAQDHLLPTAAYVGGPAEIAYHAQLGPAYAHFGLPRPVLLPRPSLTLVEPGPARALSAEDLQPQDLQQDPEAILAGWARTSHPELEAAFERVEHGIAAGMDEVERTLGALDPTLRAAADATRGRALHQIEGLHEKALRALKKRDQSRADRLRRTREALFPGGSLQERALGLVGPVARHGPALADHVRQGMDPWAKGHQFLWL